LILPLAVSLGDPAGVGPELIAEGWARREDENLPPFFVVGGAGLIAQAAKRRGLDIDVSIIADPTEAAAVFASALPVLGNQDAAYHPGQPATEGAKLALQSLTEAVNLTVSGDAAAIVTAPVAKARLAEVGFTHPGQTEFLAEACGYDACDVVMMLAGPNLRTVPVTIHIPLAQVPAVLTSAAIERRSHITALALLRDFGLAKPRLAIAALNPHAGEEGRMGDEETRIILPAIAALQASGVNATGPHPPDALFAPHMRGTYDVAICMYHDQALIPIKALDFDVGVNVTLGLPIIRTSPDHGTAFGIAGTGKASANAMIAAIRMAGECAVRRANG
jgi:4-hydroxythreonine-4-phosphate dehydrogenase